MSQKVYYAWRKNRYTKLRRSLSEFIEPCKTGRDHIQQGHLLKAIAVHIIILFFYSLIYGKDVIFKEEVWVAFWTVIYDVIVLTFFFVCKFLDILFEGDSQSQGKQLWNRMILQYMIYWAINYRKLVYPILCEPTRIVLWNEYAQKTC